MFIKFKNIFIILFSFHLYCAEINKYPLLNKFRYNGITFFELLNNYEKYYGSLFPSSDISNLGRLYIIISSLIAQLSFSYNRSHLQEPLENQCLTKKHHLKCFYELNEFFKFYKDKFHPELSEDLNERFSIEKVRMVSPYLTNINIVQMKDKKFYKAWEQASTKAEKGRVLLYLKSSIIEHINNKPIDKWFLVKDLNDFIEAYSFEINEYCYELIKEFINNNQ